MPIDLYHAQYSWKITNPQELGLPQIGKKIPRSRVSKIYPYLLSSIKKYKMYNPLRIISEDMETPFFLFGLGLVGLIFRVWLCEIKLREELEFRRRYLSRFVNYYLFIDILCAFQNPSFNAIVIVCFPVMIVTAIWDINFFMNLKKREYFIKNHGWLLLERITLHLPILIVGLYLFFHITEYLPNTIFSWIWGILLVYIPFFLLDERWTSKYYYPQAIIMIVLMVSSTTILMYVGIWL
jgi:hypothetical protein